jgi:signal transduction histidine kinase
MNGKIQYIWNLIEQSNKLSQEEKDAIAKSLKDADKEISIASFKIERLEKVKYTTTVLLEQTIEELESKRASVEQQKRELEIEAALERIRARTMAMQKSAELPQAANLLFQQIQSLGLPAFAAGYCIWEDDKQAITLWMSSEGVLQPPFKAPTTKDELFIQMRKGYEEGKSLHVVEMGGEELVAHYQYMRTLPVVGHIFDSIIKAGHSLPVFQVMHQAYFSKGFLLFITYAPVPESHEIFKRFALVFDQTYTRFLDLQKAEEQARESQIQLALERVRARTMAMQHSDELSETAYILFQQFKQLGEDPIQITIGIFNEDQNIIEFKVTGGDGSGSKIDHTFNASIDEPTLINKIFKAWKENKKSTVISLGGQELSDWIKYRNALSGKYAHDTKVQGDDRRYVSVGFFSKGALSISTMVPPADETNQILERFASVFDLTYTRFLDLKNAEAQAKEARIEAALERVRARTLAMQRSDELAETAAVLFQQLIQLGIEPNRLYIGITEDDSTSIEFWITDEDGSKVSTMFKGSAAKNNSIQKMVDGWQQRKKSIVIDMHGKELEDYFHYLGKELHVPFKGGLSQTRRWQYIAFFSKGFIGMASPEEQPNETLQLLERFAYVFNLTFTRFNDLKVAEAHALQAEQDLIEIKAARKKAEHALIELQATQKQLIQSEKMASLGELTAGIAHEIQNPLNFVNNFAEINTELVDELNTELEKGNIEEVKFLATDLKENNGKIAFHGKRAESIVKGMLQHSRASTGKKELADINALTDEFLRLSYHGLRAKEKSFNATMETSFDYNIEKVEIIPQDLGRVLLNLFNNAFYSVNEKKKMLNGLYEPKVFVSTEKSDGKIEIVVKDNGNGIPQKIIDKIYHPFFTTKPTGEGTGLGLSLSYDIITKGHNGELKVETKEGEFASFKIILPA